MDETERDRLVTDKERARNEEGRLGDRDGKGWRAKDTGRGVGGDRNRSGRGAMEG